MDKSELGNLPPLLPCWPRTQQHLLNCWYASQSEASRNSSQSSDRMRTSSLTLSGFLAILAGTFALPLSKENITFTLGGLGEITGVVGRTMVNPSSAPYSNTSIYKFRNIPYAKPFLRFQQVETSRLSNQPSNNAQICPFWFVVRLGHNTKHKSLNSAFLKSKNLKESAE